MFLSEWREFPSAPCLAKKKKNVMTARVSMLLKSRAFLTCFRAILFPSWSGQGLISTPLILSYTAVYGEADLSESTSIVGIFLQNKYS